MSIETVEATCLHCGDTRGQAREVGRVCGIESVGESVELIEEFANHRWADWRDDELARFGVKPETFERHRRTNVMHFQWIACDDTVRGHKVAKEDDLDYGIRVGQCFACGQTPNNLVPAAEVSRDLSTPEPQLKGVTS